VRMGVLGGACVEEEPACSVLSEPIITTQISENPFAEFQPKIWGDIIVWSGGGDIFMYDISSGRETQITNDSESQFDFAIWGDIIVWQDYRNRNWDIYMYNISSEIETQFTFSPFAEFHPEIWEDRIVWSENRDGKIDIYMYDISSGIETQITNDSESQYDSAIWGDIIVWHDYFPGDGTTDYTTLYWYNLSTGVETFIVNNSYPSSTLDIWGDRIVSPQGVYDIPTQQFSHSISTSSIYNNYIVSDRTLDGVRAVYLFDLDTEETIRVSYGPGTAQNPHLFGNRVVWDNIFEGERNNVVVING